MGMYLDGILTAPHIDTSGEILEIDGVDLTDFYEGKAVINFEHQNKLAEDIIGSFVYCKKIMKKDDCENDRQKMFFDMAKGPYVYVIGELFDDQGHPGAIAAAAMVRYFAKRKEKMFIGWSIEGSTLERDGNNLKRAVARRAAFTLRPCLRSAAMGVPEESDIQKLLKKMTKSESQLFEIDSDSLILSEKDVSILNQSNPFLEIEKALQDLNKTLTASGSNVAPSQLVGGAALSKEHIAGTVINRVKAAIRDKNKSQTFKETIKAALPEVSEEYIDYFADLAEDLALKKTMPSMERIGKQHKEHVLDEEQEKLVEGVYHSDKKAQQITNNRLDNNKIFHTYNDNGDKVIIKIPNTETGNNASMFYNLSSNFFDLKDHVPVTALVSNPKINEGKPLQIVQFLKGKTPYESRKAWEDAISLSKLDGSGQKLAILDEILGNKNRNKGNIIIGEDGKIKFIDNDHLSELNDFAIKPSEFSTYFDNEPVKDHVIDWVNSKDPKKLIKLLYNSNVSEKMLQEIVKRFVLYKKMLQKDKKLGDVFKEARGFLTQGVQDG